MSETVLFTIDSLSSVSLPIKRLCAFSLSVDSPMRVCALTEFPNRIAISRDHSLLVIATENGYLIHDPVTLAFIKRMEDGWKFAIAFSHDGKSIATGGNDKHIRLYSLPALEVYADMPGHKDEVKSIEFSHSDELLVSGSGDCSLIVWKVADCSMVHILKRHHAAVNSVLFLSDSMVASGSSDKSIRIWDVGSGERVAKIKSHSEPVLCLALSPSKGKFAAGSSDKTLEIFHASTYTSIRKIKCANYVQSVVFVSEDVVALGLHQCETTLYNISTGSIVRKLSKASGYIEGIVVAELTQGTIIASSANHAHYISLTI